MNIRDNFGGKADGLVWLIENQKLEKNTELRYIVPNFEMLDFSFYLDSTKEETFSPSEKLLDKANYFVDKFKGKPVIVRSSSLKEDGNNSFAGIYKSIIIDNITPNNLLSAITEVYQSLKLPKAKTYRAEHGIDDDKMGLIIQEYIYRNQNSQVLYLHQIRLILMI